MLSYLKDLKVCNGDCMNSSIMKILIDRLVVQASVTVL